MTKFSVLLSAYSRENPSYLKEALNSILSQSLFPNEIILVKDGPLTQELDLVIKDYISKYPIIKAIDLEENQGLGKALNKGLQFCSNDLIARMDTDDIAKPNRFERQIQIFEKYPEIDVCSSWIEEFEENTLTGKISSINSAVKEGNSVYYFKLEGDDHIYIADLSLSNSLPLVQAGDEVEIQFISNEHQSVVISQFKAK